MRFLVEVRIPVKVGNARLKDGSLLKQIENYLNDVKPEAVYFTLANGQRTIYLVLDLESADKMPEIGEPLWLDWKADIHLTPVMNAEDFKKAGASIQKVLEARK
ncbi:MAG: hypothetical protein ACE5K2_06725 [Candidatus Zixiibacteriota bacterium]